MPIRTPASASPSPSPSIAQRRRWHHRAAWALLLALSACGGGSDGEATPEGRAQALAAGVATTSWIEVPQVADPLIDGGFIYEMLLAHEHQHNETMLQLLQMVEGYEPAERDPAPAIEPVLRPQHDPRRLRRVRPQRRKHRPDALPLQQLGIHAELRPRARQHERREFAPFPRLAAPGPSPRRRFCLNF